MYTPRCAAGRNSGRVVNTTVFDPLTPMPARVRHNTRVVKSVAAAERRANRALMNMARASAARRPKRSLTSPQPRAPTNPPAKMHEVSKPLSASDRPNSRPAVGSTRAMDSTSTASAALPSMHKAVSHLWKEPMPTSSMARSGVSTSRAGVPRGGDGGEAGDRFSAVPTPASECSTPWSSSTSTDLLRIIIVIIIDAPSSSTAMQCEAPNRQPHARPRAVFHLESSLSLVLFRLCTGSIYGFQFFFLAKVVLVPLACHGWQLHIIMRWATPTGRRRLNNHSTLYFSTHHHKKRPVVCGLCRRALPYLFPAVPTRRIIIIISCCNV